MSLIKLAGFGYQDIRNFLKMIFLKLIDIQKIRLKIFLTLLKEIQLNLVLLQL
jgi:hypothetical protein